MYRARVLAEKRGARARETARGASERASERVNYIIYKITRDPPTIRRNDIERYDISIREHANADRRG